MVHIPFLNIEVPEVRLATLLPEAVTGGLRIASKAVDAAIRVTHPLPPQVEEAYVEEVLESFPREFQKVFRRGADGKHKNEDQLSSELEDASFDYYRRMIRTAVVGETDDDQEDVTAYKLGLDRPSIQDAVWESYRFENGVDVHEEPAAALAFENTPEELASIQATLAAAERSQREAEQREVLREQGLQRVRRGVKTGTGQSLGAAANGAVGLALGLAVVKVVGLLAQQLRRLRKPKVVKGKGKPKAQQVARPAAAAATAALQASKAPPSPAEGKAAAGDPKPKPEAASPQPRARAAARKR